VVVCAPFIGPGRERGRRAVAGGGSINASRFSIERKRGCSGEERQFSGGSRLVGAPTMEEEGGQRGGQDSSVRRRPSGVAARSCWTEGRRWPAGPCGPKSFLCRTVLLGRADRVGQNQIKSFSIFFEF
jgi:hypothetical protein